MRITQILFSSGFGGAERLFVDLCNGLLDMGHEVQAICPLDFEGLQKIDQKKTLRLDHIASHWDYNPIVEFKLRKVIQNFQPDAVHTHLARSASLVGRALRKEDIPVIANLHNYPKLKYYKNVAHVTPGTEDQRNYLLRNGIHKKNITVIPHFSNIAISSISKAKFSEPRLVALGRFVPKKGFDLLLKAVSAVRAEGIDVKLLLGGDGPEKENLLQLRNRLGLDDVVTFSGWISDVGSFLDKGAYFVLPSRDEPFGIVFLEAMARGNCIISSLSQGPKEVLSDETAFLCGVGDYHSLSDAIFSAISNPVMSEKKAATAQAVFCKKYAPEVVLKGYTDLFFRLSND